MPYRFELGPVDNPNAAFGPDDLVAVDVAKPHTALADFDIDLPYLRGLRDRALDRVRLYANGSLIFRGYLRELDWNEQAGRTRVNGPGIGDDLRDSAIERSYVNTATHEAIRDVWANDTDFDATVRDPDVSEIITGKTVVDADTTAELAATIDTIPTTAPIKAENGRLTLADSTYYKEGENNDDGFQAGPIDAPGHSGGQAASVFASVHDPTYDFTTEYDIPAGDWGVQVLISAPTAEWADTFDFSYAGAGYELFIDGERVGGAAPGFGFVYQPQDTVPQYVDSAVLDDSGTTTDFTTEINDDTADDVKLLPPSGSASAGDLFYVGYDFPFDTVELDISTNGTGTWSIVWEYYAEEYDDAGTDFDRDDDTLVDSGWRPIPNVTDNTNGFRQSGAVEWDLSDIQDDTQAGGDFTVMSDEGGPSTNEVHVRARLDTFSSMSTQPLGREGYVRAGSKQWLGGGDTGQSLSAGDHTVSIRNVDDDDQNFITNIDGVLIEDQRFQYDFPIYPNTYGGYLNGPQAKPDGYTVVFDQVDVDFNAIGITFDTSNWSDTSGAQSVGVSFDGGSTWNDFANATTADVDLSSNIGKTIDYRATLDRHGERDTATPRLGYLGQSFDAATVSYDGSDLSIIQDNTFRGSPLKILQDLHKRAGYHFVIDHAATDGAGDLTKRVESFERGTETRQPNWTTVNRSPSQSFVQYANEVTIYGELAADGTRPKVTVQNDGEVAQYGTEPYFEVRPDLSTVDQVRAAALDTLSSKVTEREQKGDIEALPTDVLPGYSYPVDWFQDGTRTDTPLERVQFQESADSMRAQLKFQRDDDVTGTVIDQGRVVDVTREAI